MSRREHNARKIRLNCSLKVKVRLTVFYLSDKNVFSGADQFCWGELSSDPQHPQHAWDPQHHCQHYREHGPGLSAASTAAADWGETLRGHLLIIFFSPCLFGKYFWCSTNKTQYLSIYRLRLYWLLFLFWYSECSLHSGAQEPGAGFFSLSLF